MMHTTNLRKVGGSVMLAVPPAILDMLHLDVGSTVGVTTDGETLIIDPRVKPQYSLDDLLDEWSEMQSAVEDNRDWVEMPAVGREL